MPEQLLDIFKILFVVLLYLFFLRVLRAVWVEVRSSPVVPVSGGDTRATRSQRSRTNAVVDEVSISQVVVLKPAEHGEMAFGLLTNTTIGRSPNAIIRLDNSFVSQQHATITLTDGVWRIADLGSTNGTRVNGERLTQERVLHRLDSIELGPYVLEVR